MSVSFAVSFFVLLVDVDTDWNDFPKMPLPSFIRVELLGQSISIALTLTLTLMNIKLLEVTFIKFVDPKSTGCHWGSFLNKDVMWLDSCPLKT